MEATKQQIEIIYLPSDFEMSQIVYFCDKVDVNCNGSYEFNEFIKGTRGGGFYIKTYSAFSNGNFEDTVDVKNTVVQAVSYSKYLTYFGGNSFSNCAALNSVTYNGRELEKFTCIISPSVESIMSGVFGGNGGSLDKNSVSSNFTRLVFEDRVGSVSFDQYCFTRNELTEIVFGSGRYALNGSDRIALLYKTENTSENCLERVIVSKETVLASGSISWYVGEYDVIVLGTEGECASLYESNCKKALPNASSVTYNPCYLGHTRSEDDFNCETPLVCSTCLAYVYEEAKAHVLGEGICLTDLFNSGYTYVGCTNEGCSVQEKTPFEAVFVWRGYSVSTYGDTRSVTQSYKINRDSFNIAANKLEEFKIGAFASVNKGDEAFAPDLNSANVITIPLGSLAFDYVDIKITGISELNVDTRLVFCIYAKINDEYYYLDGGIASKTVFGVSYNEIS